MSRNSFVPRALTILVSAMFVWAGASLAGQQTTPAGQSAQTGAGRSLGRGGGPPVPYDDYTGYTKLWDGATFTNWDGESDVWSIADGMLHADTTKTPGQHHIYYKGPGAVMRDFDLKVEFKISATGANGGIQYRSRLLYAPHKGSIENPLGNPVPANITTMKAAVDAGIAEAAPARGNPPAGRANANPNPNPPPPIPFAGFQNPWQVSGYQFDLDSNNRFTGQLYEGQGRGIVNLPGGVVQLLPDRKFIKIGTTIENPASAVKPHKGLEGDWQQAEIIARGNTLVHMINGQVITVTIDDDPASRAYQGILSLQLEGSG